MPITCSTDCSYCIRPLTGSYGQWCQRRKIQYLIHYCSQGDPATVTFSLLCYPSRAITRHSSRAQTKIEETSTNGIGAIVVNNGATDYSQVTLSASQRSACNYYDAMFTKTEHTDFSKCCTLISLINCS